MLLLCVSSAAQANDTYVAPCFNNPNGHKYCNASNGYYFYDASSNKFWMALTTINSNHIIIDRKYAEYNPKTKTVNWKTPVTQSVQLAYIMAMSSAVAGQGGLISVNSPAKTPAQMKAEEQKKRVNARKAEEAKKAEETKQKELTKLNHRKALEKKKEEGSLISCKKLYWKYSLNPLYIFSVQNPEPFKNIEGTEKTYCQLKDGTTSMLQFEEKQSAEGYQYRGLKLMDFTGKTKYYPWN